MTLTAAEREANLGYFGPFMAAWGEASPTTRADVYMDALAYWRGDLTPQQEIDAVGAALGVPAPRLPLG